MEKETAVWLEYPIRFFKTRTQKLQIGIRAFKPIGVMCGFALTGSVCLTLETHAVALGISFNLNFRAFLEFSSVKRRINVDQVDTFIRNILLKNHEVIAIIKMMIRHLIPCSGCNRTLSLLRYQQRLIYYDLQYCLPLSLFFIAEL